ncbi:RNA polymerase sigma factor [bacterium]|nr:RNA polymerase sigma factor [bacterium]
MEKKELKELKDSELLEGYRSTGDNYYVQEVFGRHKGKIQSVCLKFFRRNRSLAEDAMQDTFLKALRGAGQEDIQNAGSWLIRVAMNSCIDIHRKERAAILESHSETDSVLIAAVTNRATQQKKTRVQELLQKINELGQKQRVCLKLYLEGYSYQEIARITQYSEKEIKSAIQTGKGNLKKSFSEQ